MTAIAAFAFVDYCDLFADMRPRPVPALEAVLDWLAAVIAIEIAAAVPSDIGLLHLHLDPCTRRNGLPAVTPGWVEFEASFVEHFGVQDDLPLHATSPWNTQADIAFLDVDNQAVLIPAHRAWADVQRIAFLSRVARAALGHHPARAFAVERDVEAAMVERNIAARLLVIGRENAADKADDSQPEPLVIAERVDIPPAIALRWYHRVEIRSDSSASLANLPDKAAIGTPAPGWVAPPAQ